MHYPPKDPSSALHLLRHRTLNNLESTHPARESARSQPELDAQVLGHHALGPGHVEVEHGPAAQAPGPADDRGIRGGPRAYVHSAVCKQVVILKCSTEMH